jgi:hypothetical protein
MEARGSIRRRERLIIEKGWQLIVGLGKTRRQIKFPL